MGTREHSHSASASPQPPEDQEALHPLPRRRVPRSSPRQPAARAAGTLRSLTVLTSVKAREGGAEDLDEVAHASQVLVHVPEVGVDVVAVPERQRAPCARRTPLPACEGFATRPTSEARRPTASRGLGGPAPTGKLAFPAQRPLGAHGKWAVTGSQACGTGLKELRRGGMGKQPLCEAHRSITLAVASVERATART